MGKVITVLSTKGGVGKSTLTKTMALVLEEMGNTICIIDLCQNSSISTGFLQDRDDYEYSSIDWLKGEIEPSKVIQRFQESSIYFIPSNEEIEDFSAYARKEFTAKSRIHCLEKKIQPLRNMFDYILIDTHPSENDDLVVYSIQASDHAIIPMEVDLDSKLSTRRSLEVLKEFVEEGLTYSIVPNKVSVTNMKLRRQLKRMEEEFIDLGMAKDVILSRIRYSDVVSTMKNDNIILNQTENKYAKKIMNDYRVVTKEVIAKLEKGMF